MAFWNNLNRFESKTLNIQKMLYFKQSDGLPKAFPSVICRNLRLTHSSCEFDTQKFELKKNVGDSIIMEL